MKNKLRGGINVGTSSVLVAFVLLCLVTFAALTFISASSDLKLSQEVADRTTEYYAANMQAELFMANIEGLLSKKYNSVDSADAYYSSIEDVFSDNDMIAISHDLSDNNNVYISYSVPINDTSDLDVELIAHYPEAEDSTLFHINGWSTSTH